MGVDHMKYLFVGPNSFQISSANDNMAFQVASEPVDQGLTLWSDIQLCQLFLDCFFYPDTNCLFIFTQKENKPT